MATQNLQPLEWIQGGYKTRCEEASGASYKRGEILKLSSGQVTQVASDESTDIWALALQDSNGTQGALVDVLIIDEATILRGNVYHASAGSATSDEDNVGTMYALYVGSNKVHVDIGDTGNDAVVILSLDEGEKGDTYGRVNFKFISAVLESNDAAT